MDKYFSLLKEMLIDTIYCINLYTLYNMDEFGWPMNKKDPKWIISNALHMVPVFSSGNN